jgi:hypothetical protein
LLTFFASFLTPSTVVILSMLLTTTGGARTHNLDAFRYPLAASYCEFQFDLPTRISPF